MPIEHDWLKKYIAIMAQILGTAAGLHKKGQVKEALAAVEEGVRKAYGLTGGLALALPFQEFLTLALRGEKPTPELLAGMAELFEAWSRLLQEAGRPAEAAAAKQRAAECRACRP
jgi:hypothetical protein